MIYVILGQTASGKTALASRIAKKYNLPLIGADAFQVYKELDIGVAKPTKEEVEGLTTHLISEISITEEMNVKTYQKLVRDIIDSYIAKGQDIVISGGTFLYVRAVLYPYEFPETEIEEYDFSEYSDEELYQELLEKDKESALKTHPNNRRRVEQAMRLVLAGTPKSAVAMKENNPIYPAVFYAIDIDKDIGNDKINKRVDIMMKEGLVEEVKSFIAKGQEGFQALQAIGYKEVIKGLQEGWKEEDVAEEIKKNTRRYAKRQRTFIRHQFPGLIQLSPEEIERLIDLDQAFRSRTKLALGPARALKIEKTKALVAGVGGVGGSLFESLVRLGMQEISIIDMDRIEPSNLNRQTLYDLDDLERLKVEQAKEHALKINPNVKINCYPHKIESGYFDNFGKVDVIFDCIDDVEGKVELAKYALKIGALLIVSTGSGLRHDSTKVVYGKLVETGEPLAKAYKRRLSELGIDYSDFICVYSKEVRVKKTSKTLGSTHLVPNSFGLAMASVYIKTLD